ncbi:MAG: hypothetical protein P4L40_14265, partial [Terracidiphilus sp.]|nr:hypothetical protein [Terracidiphilus sp.]
MCTRFPPLGDDNTRLLLAGVCAALADASADDRLLLFPSFQVGLCQLPSAAFVLINAGVLLLCVFTP